jgi:sterol desaturase/sphingolipid hydroxylase (fatty acid hydroxylase superfamily)
MLEQVLAALCSGVALVTAFVFARPTPTGSLATFLASLVIVALLLRWKLRKRSPTGRSWRRLAALIFPKPYIGHISHFADLRIQLIAGLVITFAIGNYFLAGYAVGSVTEAALVGALGRMPATSLDPVFVSIIVTVVLYLAYEFAYWLDHYISHKIPFLWEFHRVHHEAEVLSPATNLRVHPVDTLVFANLTAVITGGVHGTLVFLFGKPVFDLQLFGTNAILFVFAFLLIQLQHTHLWIAFTGIWGKLLISPAHHQIHHSQNPAHFNRNLGSCLAVFDWLFGTLHVPSKKREKLTFGVAQDSDLDHQGLYHSLVMPFVRAFGHVRQYLPQSQPGPVTAAPPLQSQT